ncbi:MAG: tryptophan synthase subunit alpha [Brockia lithotrophica]|nr:tryptophan synthase subunit alpha [Brockia lithotrophica]
MSAASEGNLRDLRGAAAIEAAFRRGPRPLFIPYLTLGDPTPEVTRSRLWELARAGAGIVELGVPYSDPLADGPVLREAAVRALRHRIGVGEALAFVRAVRDEGFSLPLVLFAYTNPLLRFGAERFAREALAAGVDAVLVPDLPPEESGDVLPFLRAVGIPLIPLVALTSRGRIAERLAGREGFVYAVSSLGTTGVREQLPQELLAFLAEIRAATSLPVAVGFGIHRRDQVEMLAPHAEGIIVGSALAHLWAEGGSAEEFVRELFSGVW